MNPKTSAVFAIIFIIGSVHSSTDENDQTTTSDEPIAQESGVYVLTDDNFDTFLKTQPAALIEFYAPWCGHCQKLEPEYVMAAKLLADKESKAVLAKMDSTVHKLSAAKYEVKGYPTLKLFKQGSVMDYDGDRNAHGIVQWLEEKTDPNYRPPPSAVWTLTTSNFSKYTLEQDLILVEFYAPWCGHCKKLAPEYEKAAQRLASLPTPIPLAKVDGTVERDLGAKYAVSGYPTLKIFRKGRIFEYNGPREAVGIADYMIEQSRPAAKELKSTKEADKAQSRDDITVIGFFDQSEHGDKINGFLDACEASRENFSDLYYTFNADVAKHMKAKLGQIGIFYPQRYWSKAEPKAAFYDESDFSRESILKFLNTKCNPLVGHRTMENQQKRYGKRPLVVVYYTVDFDHALKDETEFWRKKIINVAKKYPSYIFAISDDEVFAEELKELDLVESPSDVNVAVFEEKNKRYVMDPEKYDEFNEETFNAFMKDLQAGRVKPYIKSQPVPKSDNSPVKTLVASNFEQIVNDESKDVLVEFYAPWCGHCKTLAPIYEQLAEKLKSDKNLIIAKFDATANDLFDDFPVEGFPTIYFAPSGKKDKPLKYTGGRTFDDLLKYLRENAVASFKKTEL